MMRAHLRGGVGLVCLLGVLAGCGGVSGHEPGGAVEPGSRAGKGPARRSDEPSGTRRMRLMLDQLVRQSIDENPYFGEGRVRRLRAELAELPPGVHDMRAWFFNLRLGRDELRLGNTDQAIRRHAEAYRQLETWRNEIPRGQVLRTIFELGVAHMRRAESQNCVARHTSESCILPIRGSGVYTVVEDARAASRYFLEVLRDAPKASPYALRARWLLNLVSMTLGEYPEGVPEPYRIPPRAFVSDEPWPRFEDAARRRGLDGFEHAGGVIADDFDGDGLLDLMTSSSAPTGPLRLYRNLGRVGFEEATEAAGLGGLWGGLNMVQADYDNDGDVDVLVLRGAWWRELGRLPNSLLRNDGDGTFTDATLEAGLAEARYPTQTAAWSDYDNDGDLDLYVGNESGPEVRAPGELYRNDGRGRFSDVAAGAGVENLRYAKAVAWGDYDGDGFDDLYVSNLGAANRLYHNDGDGTFTDVAPKLGVTAPTASFSCWFWDYDNDGVLDLLASAYGGPGLPPDIADVAARYLGQPGRGETTRLYRGRAEGGFEEVAERVGLAEATLPMGANFGDLDNDGFLDFYLGTGYPFYEALIPNVMYHNRQGESFADVTSAGGFGHLQKGHGIAFADLDNDGDQDVYAQMGGMYPGDAFGNALFVNPGFGHHWIKLQLIGVQSNRSAIGARIRLEIVDAGRARTIHRRVGSGASFGGNPLRQEIGLGAAERIELLEIHWPASGLTQRFRDLPVDRALAITEGRDDLVEPPLPESEL